MYYALKQRHVHGVVMGASTDDTIKLVDEESALVTKYVFVLITFSRLSGAFVP